MSLPDTEACSLSANRRIIGKDDPSQMFINRLNSLDAVFCDIIRRTETEASDLYEYCPNAFSSSSSSSSSSIGCLFDCVTVGPDSLYQISVNDLNQDAYDALELLEQETCATLRKLLDFENINETCFSSSSSSSSSNSSSSSSSSSHSSSSSSSSSSSNSGPEVEACPNIVYLAAYCPTFNASFPLYKSAAPGLGYGDCAYRSLESISSSSSSSSSHSSSSSSSSGFSSSSSSSGVGPSSSSSSSSSSSGFVCNFYVSGAAVDFDPTVGIFLAHNDGPSDILITAFNPSGSANLDFPALPYILAAGTAEYFYVSSGSSLVGTSLTITSAECGNSNSIIFS